MNFRQIFNERGFTLLESLFQLTVFILFSAISLLILLWIRDLHQLELMKDEVNWELFVYDLHQYNMNSASGKVLNSNTLQLEILNDPEERLFVFDKSEEHLRKRSNKGGNEIMLPFVEEWELAVDENELKMRVVMKNGTRRERDLVLPLSPK
ncbi:competence type IV pilus minor pilin ComGF [Solibacillus sp. FSL W7-1464]|uniref:competence type IV pilus minor pilin ComGF n=1 Tax=Solibacillus sp. FSL W7-1464 TaxID=2921706 RepID=UPI0030F9A427